MKRKIINILFGLLFLSGLGVLLYPTVSNQWNTYRQSRLITSYESIVSEMAVEDFSEEWRQADYFNRNVNYDALYTDAFGTSEKEMEDTQYWQILNVAGDGIMGYLSIPKINIRLAIYHGTEENVLQTGVGHVSGTMLPIGGESTHCVLAAHRGLPSARLFTDIDQLVKGDMIYIHILDEVFAYQVDQILDMVDKNDADALLEALSIEAGKDYISLFTCTPYGVNSHRLIVRGTRVEYSGEEEKETVSVPEAMLESVQNYYMIYLIFGLSVTFFVIVIMKSLLNRKIFINKKLEEDE